MLKYKLTIARSPWRTRLAVLCYVVVGLSILAWQPSVFDNQLLWQGTVLIAFTLFAGWQIRQLANDKAQTVIFSELGHWQWLEHNRAAEYLDWQISPKSKVTQWLIYLNLQRGSGKEIHSLTLFTDQLSKASYRRLARVILQLHYE